MGFRPSYFDQSPALSDGVAALPPFPMKWTVAPLLQASITIKNRFEISVIGRLSSVFLRLETYLFANSVKSSAM